jgi:S1-C subfamily serine protease
MRVMAIWLGVVLAGCGGAVASSAPVETVASAEEEAPVAPPRREGTIARAELDAVLEQGLGRFLGRVTTEAHLEGGRFVGHRLLELRSELFAGVDLQAGDTLVEVNGMPVERPEQALRAWEALRVASELTLDILRDGEARQLRYAIED